MASCLALMLEHKLCDFLLVNEMRGQCTLSWFADGTELMGAVCVLEVRVTTHRDLHSLEGWAKGVQLRQAEALHVVGNALCFCSLGPTAGEQLCWESPAVLLD